MSRQWLRRLSLSLGGSPFDVGDLRVTFQIRDMVAQTPRHAAIRIYNLAPSVAQGIKARGVDWKVELYVGYASGGEGRIFVGDVKQVRIGKENPTDTYLDLFALDGGRAYNRGIVRQTLKANSTGRDVVQAIVKPMGGFGVQPGYVFDALAKKVFPRPLVLFGMCRDELRKIVQAAGGQWSILHGRVEVTPKDGSRPGESTTTLNSATGLIGMPEQTELGIIARCLINPAIDRGSQVHIDQRSIQEAVVGFSNQAQVRSGANAQPFVAEIAADGIYRVLALDHFGDTRGNPFYSELYCSKPGQQTAAQAQALWGGDN